MSLPFSARTVVAGLANWAYEEKARALGRQENHRRLEKKIGQIKRANILDFWCFETA